MKTLIRMVAIGLVLALIVAGGFWLVQSRVASQAGNQSTDDYSQVIPVQQGDLSATISVVGELYAPQNEAMRFEHATGTTTLLSLNAAAGNGVEAGQELAAIDPSHYQQALDQAQSDLQEAETKLADLQTPATELEIARADLAIAKARLALQQAQDSLSDLTDPDVDSLQANVASAELALTQAQSNLLAQEDDGDAQDQLSRLEEAEADLSAEYSRLANETYSDNYYQDRLRLAYNALLAAQDARISAETQHELSLLQAQIRVRQAQQKLADAQEALAEAQAGPDELELARAQQAVAQAEADVAEAQEARGELDEGADAVDLAAAQADVDKKRLAVTGAEADLAGATLLAPFAGTILETNAEPGDRINATSQILTLANLDQLQVVASVDETTIRQVSAGQNATITFDAFPEQSFSGQVLSVPLQGTLQGGVMVYDVPISLQGAEDLPLLVGMTANVDIQVGYAQDVLLVPTMALQQLGGLYQVLVPNSDPEGDPGNGRRLLAVPVEVGLSNGTYTQIVRGLNLGDQVVVQLTTSESTLFGGPGGGMNMMMGGSPLAGPPPQR